MTQSGLPMGGSHEVINTLPSIGAYSLHQHRRGNDFQDLATIYCRTEELPLGMDIRFPDQKEGVSDDGEPPKPEEPEYDLKWLSGIPIDIVVQIIREAGEEQPDGVYLCEPEGDGLPDLGRPLKPEERRIMTAAGNMRAGHDLEEIITPRFTMLGSKSSGLRLYWIADEIAAPDGPEFVLGTDGNRPVTDPDIPPFLYKTMASEHLGKIASSLENLAAIYEQFRNGPPQPTSA